MAGIWIICTSKPYGFSRSLSPVRVVPRGGCATGPDPSRAKSRRARAVSPLTGGLRPTISGFARNHRAPARSPRRVATVRVRARPRGARAMVATRERERENASTSARARAVRKKSTKERLVSQRAVAVVGAIVEQTRRRREGGDRDGGGTRTRARRDAAGGIGRGIATRTFEKIPVPTDEREAAAGVPEEYRAVSTVLLRWHCDRDKLHVPLDPRTSRVPVV